MSNNVWVEIGSILGPHGINGQVKIKSFTEVPEGMFLYKNLFIGNEQKPIKIKLVRKIKHNLICTVENIKTRNEAETIRNLILYVKRDEFPLLNDNEFYQRDLLNFEVFNLKRESFGFIISFNDFGGGQLVEVENLNKRFYLPIGETFLKNINYQDREVILDIDIAFIKN
ncbi:MAG: 16S rRNA processing protein RimM [Alphaproteobacteria bacterium]|nr:16S rRNA processing protein RimM [Alphaproteobacteria bacterium]